MNDTDARPCVAVLRFSSVGDIVVAAAAVDALARAWPEARIVFVTKAHFADLVRDNPAIDDVVALARGESVFALWRRVAALHPTHVLDLHGKLRGMVLRRLVPAKRRGVFAARPWTQTAAVRLGLRVFRAEQRVADRYHVAVEQLVGRAVPRGQLRYVVGAAAAAEARAQLAGAGIDLHRPLIGMAPGALWLTKRWPAERYGELAARLGERGYQVAVLGSGAEAALTASVAAYSPRAVSLAGSSLAVLAGLVDACGAFIANDSGPMHIARALGVPTVAMFGSTDPGQFAFTGHTALSVALDCAPCSRYGRARCPRGDLRCLLELSVEQALVALEAGVAAGRRPFLDA